MCFPNWYLFAITDPLTLSLPPVVVEALGLSDEEEFYTELQCEVEETRWDTRYQAENALGVNRNEEAIQITLRQGHLGGAVS